MTDDPTTLRRLAEAALERAAECPDCDDNNWDLNDAADPQTILALLDERDALRAALTGMVDTFANGRGTARLIGMCPLTDEGHAAVTAARAALEATR